MPKVQVGRLPYFLVAVVSAITSFVVAAVLTPLIRREATRRGLLDMPDPRKVHLKPKPRLGGLAIVAGSAAGFSVTVMMGVERFPEEIERLSVLGLAAVVLVVAMLFDDLRGLRPFPKLAIQIAVALIVAWPTFLGRTSALYIGSVSWPFGGTLFFPLEVGIAVTIVWFVGMMNTLNWLDGLDGLAGGVTIVASLILFVHTWLLGQWTIALLPLVLAASCLGFLLYNVYPASIMMGDSGAMFLGFSLAAISIIGGAKIGTALLTLGVPIIDVAWVIIHRIMHRRSPMTPDRTHLHHRLLDMGLSQRQVVLLYCTLSAGFGALAIFLPTGLTKLVALALLGTVVLALLWYGALRRPAAV